MDAAQKKVWTERLRALGVKFAHSDDGWVKREASEPYVSVSWYPMFNDGPVAGDLIAFGAPTERPYYRSWHDVWKGRKDAYAVAQMRDLKGRPESACDGYRLCRVTRVETRQSILGETVKYYYEDTGERMPPREPAWTPMQRLIFGWRR